MMDCGLFMLVRSFVCQRNKSRNAQTLLNEHVNVSTFSDIELYTQLAYVSGGFHYMDAFLRVNASILSCLSSSSCFLWV